ncbi:MAG: hypothetical protein FWH08_05745 [Oscillospiraceae bacterium]|nr:hypothetical protein [Oscillospiraceae bacterium]
MTLKTKTIISVVVAGLLTAGLLVFLAVAFFEGFPLWSSLSLLGATVLTIVAWINYYIMFTKYKDSLNTKKKRYHQKGNRKESRKGIKK